MTLFWQHVFLEAENTLLIVINKTLTYLAAELYQNHKHHVQKRQYEMQSFDTYYLYCFGTYIQVCIIWLSYQHNTSTRYNNNNNGSSHFSTLKTLCVLDRQKFQIEFLINDRSRAPIGAQSAPTGTHLHNTYICTYNMYTEPCSATIQTKTKTKKHKITKNT